MKTEKSKKKPWDVEVMKTDEKFMLKEQCQKL